jgi:hypothetical protein
VAPSKEEEPWEYYGSYQVVEMITAAGTHRMRWTVMRKRLLPFARRNGSSHTSEPGARQLFESKQATQESDLSSLTHRPHRLSWFHGLLEDEQKMLVYVWIGAWIGITVILCLLLLGQVIGDSFPRWSKADRRARKLLRAILTREQYCQLIQQGYIDIPSPSNPHRVYRVPLEPGRVCVIEKERLKATLCLQPLERVPAADIVAIHKLMIEADEETYLKKANVIVPIGGDGWLGWFNS